MKLSKNLALVAATTLVTLDFMMARSSFEHLVQDGINANPIYIGCFIGTGAPLIILGLIAVLSLASHVFDKEKK